MFLAEAAGFKNQTSGRSWRSSKNSQKNKSNISHAFRYLSSYFPKLRSRTVQLRILTLKSSIAFAKSIILSVSEPDETNCSLYASNSLPSLNGDQRTGRLGPICRILKGKKSRMSFVKFNKSLRVGTIVNNSKYFNAKPSPFLMMYLHSKKNGTLLFFFNKCCVFLDVVMIFGDWVLGRKWEQRG